MAEMVRESGWPVIWSFRERRRDELRAVSIGPVTSAELRREGVDPAAEATRPGNEDMVAAVALRMTKA